MNVIYLNRVLIYMQQELPEEYRNNIKLADVKLVIHIPDTVNFQMAYEQLHQKTISIIDRIRHREIDLEFTIKSTYQERDFKILK